MLYVIKPRLAVPQGVVSVESHDFDHIIIENHVRKGNQKVVKSQENLAFLAFIRNFATCKE